MCIFGWEFGEWDRERDGPPIQDETFYGWTFADLHELQLQLGVGWQSTA